MEKNKCANKYSENEVNVQIKHRLRMARLAINWRRVLLRSNLVLLGIFLCGTFIDCAEYQSQLKNSIEKFAPSTVLVLT
jgi:hypothetical protein